MSDSSLAVRKLRPRLGSLRRVPRRPRRARLRVRVLAGVMSVTLVTLAAFDIAAVTQMRRYLISQADVQLQDILSQLQQVISRYGQGPPAIAARGGRLAAGPDLLLDPRLAQYHVLLFPGPGQAWYNGGNEALSPAFGIDEFDEHRFSHDGWNGQGLFSHIPVRMMEAPLSGGGELLASVSLSGVNRTLGQLTLILIVGSAVAALIVALGGGWLMRRGLRPIEAMAAEADRITAGDLTDRVTPQDPRTEIGRLGSALNGMLARIEAFVAEREASQQLTRQFFADASHELRNPLASLRANAELYQQGAIGGRAGVEQAMARIALEAQRMSRLVDDMLRLARLDQHPGQQRGRVDVTALLAGCAERWQRASPGRAWQVRIAAGLVADGDEEMLRRAVDNLLANVCAHTPSATTATLTAARQADTVRIEVSDDGPGVPASQLPRIFDRFYRAGAPSERPGSGLGLAIVSAIAAAHGGTAQAAANQPHGLRITLTVPSPPYPTARSAAMKRGQSGTPTPVMLS